MYELTDLLYILLHNKIGLRILLLLLQRTPKIIPKKFGINSNRAANTICKIVSNRARNDCNTDLNRSFLTSSNIPHESIN